MGYCAEYRQKLKTPEVAVECVKSGNWVDYSFAATIPEALDKALAARKNELKDIKIRGGIAVRPLAVVEADPERETFTYCSWHFSGYERALHDKGLCNYIPMLYRNKPLFYSNNLEVDVAMVTVAPMDQHGYFNFSLTNSATKAIVEKAKTVIAEVNNSFPRALGGLDECIHISDVDIIVEGNHPKPAVLNKPSSNETDLKIARYILDEITDGATIQLGIGGMPNTVGSLLAQSDLKDLGMHTEMLVDAYYDMYLAGKLTNKYKHSNCGKGVWTFCLGSEELYQWVDNNPGLASYPVNYTNNPSVMSQLENLIAINNCVEVDLFGQVCSESSGIRQISGTGGQLDFVTGSYLSPGGKSFICFSSTFKTKEGEIKSRVTPTLVPGGIVTDPRTQIHYLVTEYGKVNLSGRSTWERAEMIISIAHPQFRNELIKEAEALNIWRRTNKIAD